MRARLPEWTVFVGLMAMLKPGLETETVIQSVGFKDSFHFQKRDCECMQLILSDGMFGLARQRNLGQWDSPRTDHVYYCLSQLEWALRNVPRKVLTSQSPDILPLFHLASLARLQWQLKL